MNDDKGRIHVDDGGEDLAQARDVLATAYAGVDWRADESDSPFSFRYAAAGDRSMTVRAVRFDGRLEGEMPASDDFVVTWITRGTGLLDVGRRPIALQPGRPQLWPCDAFHFSFENYDQRLVQVNRGAVRNILGERGETIDDLRFDHSKAPTDEALRRWRNTTSLVSKTVLDREASPILQAEMGRVAAISLLELYPIAPRRLPPELFLAKNTHVRAAAEYAHHHAHLPITSSDLAGIANVSLRALQLAFVRLLGVTPNTYLRQIRLDRIHAELGESDPATTQVAAVAKRWGFAHAGRFAAAYTERFGHYPSETLARS